MEWFFYPSQNMFSDTFEPEKCYHIFNHAVHNNLLFIQDTNYHYFLQQLMKHTQFVCDLYAYCLMPNHFHLLARIKNQESLIEYFHTKNQAKDPQYNPDNFDKTTFDTHKFVMQQFQNFCNGYAQAFNRFANRKGVLFMDNLKRKVVKNEVYFTKLIHYIHYNPVHHGFCKDLNGWRFTSYHSFLDNRTTPLAREYVLNWFGSVQEYSRFHQSKPDSRLTNLMEL